MDLKSDKIKNSIYLNNKIANALLCFGVYAINKLEYKNIVSLYCDLESPKFLYAIDSNDKKYYLDFLDKMSFLQNAKCYKKFKKIAIYLDFCNKAYVQDIVQKNHQSI